MPPTIDPSKTELLRGTLDMLVLKTLTLGPMHGYGIAQHLQQVSKDALQVEEGSLYPALQRMRQRGWIRAEWKQTPNNQRARYYTLTPVGRKQLGEEETSFAQVLAAIALVMRRA
jgi:PadR family transcriptional regulator PadR